MPITQAFGIPPVHRDNSVEFPCQLGLSIGFGGTIHHCREPLLVFHTSNNHMRMVISRDQTYYYTSGYGCAAGMWLSGALLRILWKKYDHPVVYHDDPYLNGHIWSCDGWKFSADQLRIQLVP